MKHRKKAMFVVLFLFISPFLFRQISSAGGIEWMYWLSSYLCYSQMLVFGTLLVVVPKKLRNWLNWLNNEDAPYDHRFFMKIFYALFGLGIMVMGLLNLFITTRRFFTECQPILSCFWGCYGVRLRTNKRCKITHMSCPDTWNGSKPLSKGDGEFSPSPFDKNAC